MNESGESNFDSFRKQVEEMELDLYLKPLREAILSEEDLKELEIAKPKQYLGPIHEGSLGEIYGPRGLGKTFLRDVISLCMTRGLDLKPWKNGHPAGVLIIDGEMSLDSLKERQMALSRNLEIRLLPLDIIANEQLFRKGGPTINLTNGKWREALLKLVETEGDRWDVVILDNLSSLLPGTKENDTEAWATTNALLLQLRWMGKAAIFVHHAGKSGEQRGTSGREDSLDFVLKLSPAVGHHPEDGCRFNAILTKSRSLTGPEAAPFTFGIMPHPDGGLTWTITGQKEQRKETIIALLGNGVAQKDIVTIMSVSKGYVSQIKASAIIKKVLNEKGGFTPEGQRKYGGFDLEKYLV